MEEKKSHTKNERSLPDHEEQELGSLLWLPMIPVPIMSIRRSIVLFLVPSKNAYGFQYS